MSDISRRLFLGFLGVAISGCGRDSYERLTAAPSYPEGTALQSPIDALEAFRSACLERNTAFLGNILSTQFTSQKPASPYNDIGFINGFPHEERSLVRLLESDRCESFEVDTSRASIDIADGVAMANGVDITCRIRSGSEAVTLRSTVLARLVTSETLDWKLETLVVT